MEHNSINSILEAVCSPCNFFSNLKEFQVQRNANGDILFSPSNAAVTLKVLINGQFYSLKCYMKHKPNRAEHFIKLKEFFQKNQKNYFVDFEFYSNELSLYDVDASMYSTDVLLTHWVEGETLHRSISEAAHLGRKDIIRNFREKFLSLVIDFNSFGYVHGDLKPQNIIFESKTNELKVIDYDASWIESISNLQNTEIGTYWFQHSSRDDSHWGKMTDNYSIVLITVSLLAIEQYLHLFEKYNNLENIIFVPFDILNAKCPAYNDLRKLWSNDNTLMSFLDSLKSIFPYSNSLMNFVNDIKFYSSQSVFISPDKVLDSAGRFRRYYDDYYLFGYVDENFKVVTNANWHDIQLFYDGYSIVRGNGKSYFLNEYMKLSPIGFDSIVHYNSNCAIVIIGGKYGIIEMKSYGFIAKPIYDFAELLQNGKTVVTHNDKCFVIDEITHDIKEISN